MSEDVVLPGGATWATQQVLPEKAEGRNCPCAGILQGVAI